MLLTSSWPFYGFRSRSFVIGAANEDYGPLGQQTGRLNLFHVHDIRYTTMLLLFISGNHAIGTVRKFPTLPMNGGGGGGGVGGGGGGNSCAPNGGNSGTGLWIDPSGGVWRQAANAASCTTKEQLPGYAQATAQRGQSNTGGGGGQQQQPLPDYER